MTIEYIMEDDCIVYSINRWIESIVVGLNLCPFAKSVRQQGHLRICLAKSGVAADCLQQLVDEAVALVQADQHATTLFVLPTGFSDFDDFLDLLALSNALMEELGFTGILQLASFHPNYQFEGIDVDDVSNWTNRAPLPIIHLLKETSVSSAVDAHPNPEGIAMRNINKLEQLGIAGIEQLFKELNCRQSQVGSQKNAGR